MRPIAILALSALLSTQLAFATPIETEMADIHSAITSELQKLDASIPIESIEASPMEGVFMVTLKGGHILYTSANGKHLIRGDMLEIRDNGIVNLTEEIHSKANAAILKSLNTDDMIIFKPAGKTKAVVYAFTDVDCGYCRKLHQELNEMNKLGIELRYMAFPRGGESSSAYNKMVDAWCAPDRKQAITDLKSGKTIATTTDDEKKATCKAIIDKQYQLGIEMGVNGTPAMVLEDGKLIPGYRPASDLAKMLGINDADSK